MEKIDLNFGKNRTEKKKKNFEKKGVLKNAGNVIVAVATIGMLSNLFSGN